LLSKAEEQTANFSRGVNEIFSFLVLCTAYIGIYLQTVRHKLSVQSSRVKRFKKFFLDCSNLENGTR